MTRNAFTSAPIFDAAAPDSYLPRQAILTLWIHGPANARAEFADLLNSGSHFADAPVLSRLGICRETTAATVRGASAERLFHIPQPYFRDSLTEIAGQLAAEIIDRWSGKLTVVVTATPHRRYRWHQVLAVHGGRWAYTEYPATRNDTVVAVCGDGYAVGLLRDGIWQPADQDEEFSDVTALCDRHIHDVHANDDAAFIVLLDGDLDDGDLQDAGLTASDAGLGLLWVITSDY